MKYRFLFIVFLIVLWGCNSKRDVSSYDLVIQNVKLFNGEQIYENATVLIDSNTVQEIIKDKVTAFEGENIIDGNGFTLTPAFINAHVHAFKPEQTHEAVQAGVLTLLDLFSTQPAVSDSLRTLGKTSNQHAYYYSAGPTVTVEGGHGSQFGPVPLVATPEDVPKFIEDRIAEGSDYIKVIIERGDASYEAPTLSDEMIKIAGETTQKKGVKSVAHITWISDALKAAEYGIDGLAHMWSRDSTGITDKQLDYLKDSSIFIIPTISTWQRADETKWRKVNIDLLKQDLLKLYKKGIPLLAGTDPPNFKINYGSDLFKELELFVEVGMSELDALKSATSQISKAFELEDKGYIKKGTVADLVLIQGDPTSNIKDLYNVKRV